MQILRPIIGISATSRHRQHSIPPLQRSATSRLPPSREELGRHSLSNGEAQVQDPKPGYALHCPRELAEPPPPYAP